MAAGRFGLWPKPQGLRAPFERSRVNSLGIFELRHGLRLLCPSRLFLYRLIFHVLNIGAWGLSPGRQSSVLLVGGAYAHFRATLDFPAGT